MAALVLPLSLLSQPSTVAVDGRQGSPGGSWAASATSSSWARETWGKSIRPAKPSSWPRSACAASPPTSLSKAEECKLKEDWTGLSATLEQIAICSPIISASGGSRAGTCHTTSRPNGTNYHDRYYWVVKGIEFLEKGVDYNRTSRGCLPMWLVLVAQDRQERRTPAVPPAVPRRR